MNKVGILAVLGAGLVLGGVGLLGGLTGGTDDLGTLDGGVGEVQAVVDVPLAQTKADNVRLAYKPGACPSAAALPRTEGGKGRAPAACTSMIQGDGYCMCWTQQAAGEVDEEITSANQLPAADRKRGVVCCPKDPKVGVPEVRWERDAGEVADGCRVFARPINDVVAGGGAETDMDVQVRAACAPCLVPGAGNWGAHCPQCLCAPGGCAAVCAEMVGP